MTGSLLGVLLLAIPALFIALEARFWYALGAEGLRTSAIWYRAVSGAVAWWSLLVVIVASGELLWEAVGMLFLASVAFIISNRQVQRHTSRPAQEDRGRGYLEEPR